VTDKGDKVHILLVDDEVEFLAATATALKRRGFRVSTAPDGDSALRLIQDEIIDVAILDLKMPGISGNELFRIIKRRWPEIPVIMLTGHGSVQNAFKSSREGVVEYLAKPCDIEKLASVARKVVAERSSLSQGEYDASIDHDIRVLVIDDEQELLDVLTQTLSRRGMRVATAKTGADAFERLEGEDFDVVLLDLKLRGEQGLDLLEKIKSRHPSTEVIIHTGHPSVDSAVDGLRGGAFDYLPKPTDMKKMITRIRDAYQLRRRRSEEMRERMIQDILEKQPD
jgi:DNA-binding NtrC family response regulator